VLDFFPNQGTVVTIAKQEKGVILGKDFNDALLRIWLGEKPVTKGLKEKLLVTYSRKPVTQFSPHALRGKNNKKPGDASEIKNLK
jgi:hypothetical protein